MRQRINLHAFKWIRKQSGRRMQFSGAEPIFRIKLLFYLLCTQYAHRNAWTSPWKYTHAKNREIPQFARAIQTIGFADADTPNRLENKNTNHNNNKTTLKRFVEAWFLCIRLCSGIMFVVVAAMLLNMIFLSINQSELTIKTSHKFLTAANTLQTYYTLAS